MMALRAAFAVKRSVPGASVTLYRNVLPGLTIRGCAAARFSVVGEAKFELVRVTRPSNIRSLLDFREFNVSSRFTVRTVRNWDVRCCNGRHFFC